MNRIPVILVALVGLICSGFAVGNHHRRISVIFLHHGLLDKGSIQPCKEPFHRLALCAACQRRGTANQSAPTSKTGEFAGTPQQRATARPTTEIRAGLKHVECEPTGIHGLESIDIMKYCRLTLGSLL